MKIQKLAMAVIAWATIASGADVTLTGNVAPPASLDGGSFTASGTGTPGNPYFYDFTTGPGTNYTGLNLATFQVVTSSASLTNASMLFNLNGGTITATTGDLSTLNSTAGALGTPSVAGQITITNAGNITIDDILANGAVGGNFRQGANISVFHNGSLIADVINSQGARENSGNILLNGDQAGTGATGSLQVNSILANNINIGGDTGKGGTVTISGYTNVAVAGEINTTKRVLSYLTNDVTVRAFGSISVGGPITTLNSPAVTGSKGGDVTLIASNGVNGAIAIGDVNTSSRGLGGSILLYSDTSISVSNITTGVAGDGTKAGSFTATHDGAFGGGNLNLFGDRGDGGNLTLNGDAHGDGADGTLVIGAITANDTDIAGGTPFQDGSVSIRGYTGIQITGTVALASAAAKYLPGTFTASANGNISVGEIQIAIGTTNKPGGKISIFGRDTVSTGSLVSRSNSFLTVNGNAVTVADFTGTNDTVALRVRNSFTLTTTTGSEANHLFLSASNAASAFTGVDALNSTVFLDLPFLQSVSQNDINIDFSAHNGNAANPGNVFEVLFGEREDIIGGSDYTDATVVGTFTNLTGTLGTFSLSIDDIATALGQSWTEGYFGLRSVNTNLFDLDGDGTAAEMFSSLTAINTANSQAFYVQINLIPEPSTALFLAGAGLLLLRRRRS